MPKRIYPLELEPFVREKFKTYTARQLVPIIRQEFGIDMMHSQVKAYIGNHGIRSGREGKKLPERRITTPEIDDFIHSNYKGTGYQEMADLVNERFGTDYTADQMGGYYGRNHLDSGLTGRFPKGHEPANKGKTWDEFMSRAGQEASRKTQFKKGHVPHNGGAPVGEIRIWHGHKKRGGHPYCWQKTAQPNVWRMKHVVEWEEHNGPVPEGHIVCFADGDTLNWHIENLVLVTRAQNAVKNRWGIKGNDRESAEAANLIADLKMATSRAKKRANNHSGKTAEKRTRRT